MTKKLDLTKQRFGRLVVLKMSTKRTNGGGVKWECLCDCGKKCTVWGPDLLRKTTQSCGCLHKERVTKHGMSRTPIWIIWDGIIQRCENPNNKDYKNYGGRGIKICERWKNSFENFYADVGDPPEGMTLDRWPDNDGDYEPTNWRWATRSQQATNRRPASYGPFKQRWFYGHGPNGEMIIENNQCHVAKIFELTSVSISACLHNKQKTHKNWTFQWIPL